MIITKKDPNYYIATGAVQFVENALDNPDRVAISLEAGTVIQVYIRGAIDYAADGNYRRWRLSAFNTLLTDQSAQYIYARLNRDDQQALVVFSAHEYLLGGKEIIQRTETEIAAWNEANPKNVTDSGEKIYYQDDELNASQLRDKYYKESGEDSQTYYWIRIGSITPGNALREITYDSGLLGTFEQIYRDLDNAWFELFDADGNVVHELEKAVGVRPKNRLGLASESFVSGYGMFAGGSGSAGGGVSSIKFEGGTEQFMPDSEGVVTLPKFEIGGVSSWKDVKEKPFETLGTNFVVNQSKVLESVKWEGVSEKPDLFQRFKAGTVSSFDFGKENHQNGLYYIHADYTASANPPFDYGLLLNLSNNAGSSQIAVGSSGNMYVRSSWNGGGWTDWKKVMFDGGLFELFDANGNVVHSLNSAVGIRPVNKLGLASESFVSGYGMFAGGSGSAGGGVSSIFLGETQYTPDKDGVITLPKFETGGVSLWNDVKEKPFETLGTNFVVNQSKVLESVKWEGVSEKPDLFQRFKAGTVSSFDFGKENHQNGLYYIHADYTASANPPFNYGLLLNLSNNAGSSQIAVGSAGSMYVRSSWNGGTWTDWKKVMYEGELFELFDANGNVVHSLNSAVGIRPVNKLGLASESFVSGYGMFAGGSGSAGGGVSSIFLGGTQYTPDKDGVITLPKSGASSWSELNPKPNKADLNAILGLADWALKPTAPSYSDLTGSIPTWNQDTTGNAETATKLKKSFTLWGVSVDGGSEVTTAPSLYIGENQVRNYSGVQNLTGIGSVAANNSYTITINPSYDVGFKVTDGSKTVTFGKSSVSPYIWCSGEVPFRIATNSTERVRITADGKFGIQKSAPIDVLDVNGNIAITGGNKRIYFGDKSHYLELNANGFQFSHGVSSMSYISAYGLSGSSESSVSLTQSETYGSNVRFDSSVHPSMIINTNDIDKGNFSLFGGTQIRSNDNSTLLGYVDFAQFSGDNIVYYGYGGAAESPAMWIDKAGHVAIGRGKDVPKKNDEDATINGRTNLSVKSDKYNAIRLERSTNIGVGIEFASNGNSSGTGSTVVDAVFGHYVNTNGFRGFVWDTGTRGASVGTNLMTLFTKGYSSYAAGQLYLKSSLVSASDKRLKQNIKALEYRGALSPVEFEKDGVRQLGFIAQDVKELYPELVFGEESETEYLSLAYANITAVLAAQANNHDARIAELERENKELKRKLNIA